jgi:copper homeostasis protein CutC
MGRGLRRLRLGARRNVLIGKTLTHGGDDGNEQVLVLLERLLDFGTNVSVGELDIVLGISVTVHQVEEFLHTSQRRLFHSAVRRDDARS